MSVQPFTAPPQVPAGRVKITIPMLTRMVALRRAGLSFGAVAAVIRLDYGVAVTEVSVRDRVHYWTGERGTRNAPYGMSKDNSRNWPNRANAPPDARDGR